MEILQDFSVPQYFSILFLLRKWQFTVWRTTYHCLYPSAQRDFSHGLCNHHPSNWILHGWLGNRMAILEEERRASNVTSFTHHNQNFSLSHHIEIQRQAEDSRITDYRSDSWPQHCYCCSDSYLLSGKQYWNVYLPRWSNDVHHRSSVGSKTTEKEQIPEACNLLQY